MSQGAPANGWVAGLLASLRGRLFVGLLALGGCSALGVGVATYVSVRTEADQLFDYHLQQMAGSLRDQGRIAPQEQAALGNAELDYLVQVWSPDGLTLYTRRPQGMPELLPPRAVLGFSEVELAGQSWRVYATATPFRVIQVAQPLAVRRQLAAAAAGRSVWPIALASPLVAALLWWLIGASLAPLARVVRAVEDRGVDSLDALPVAQLPSELLPLVQAFNDLLARLATAFEAQRGFVADAAHELRTPLTALKLQIGLLAGAAPGPEFDASTARLRAGVDRAAHLVEQLLALARAEPGASAADTPLDLVEVARQALADAQPLAERQGVLLHLEADATVPLVGDAQGWRGALRNLLDNAVRHGARQAWLRVQAPALVEPGGLAAAWRVQLDDDGPGIAPEFRTQVLGRFQRGPGPQAEGSGLGLAIVEAVARRQGARVQLGSSPAGGLRVEIGPG